MKKIKKILTFALVLIIMFSIENQVRAEEQIVKAKIVVVYGTEEVTEENETKKVQKVSVKILEGNYEEEEYDAKYYIDSKTKHELKKGTEVYAKISQNDGEISDVTIQEIIRQNYIIYFTAILLFLMIIAFKKNSMKIILSIIFSVLITKFLIVDQITLGNNSIIISIMATILIILFNAIINNGINRKSLIVIISSTVGTLIAGILMKIFSDISIFENNITNILNIQTNSNINYNRLMISSVIVASIGLSFDISNNIVKKLIDKESIEIKKEIKENYIEILNKYNIMTYMYIGIFLTYIVAINKQANLLNNEVITLISLMVIAILLSLIILIPLTILLYKILNKDDKIYKTQSKNIINGQRTLKL